MNENQTVEVVQEPKKHTGWVIAGLVTLFGGLVTGGIHLVKRIKAKRAAKAEEAEVVEED